MSVVELETAVNVRGDELEFATKVNCSELNAAVPVPMPGHEVIPVKTAPFPVTVMRSVCGELFWDG
jgi:hypothetical protein